MEKQGFDLAMHYFRAFAIFSVISVHMWIVPPLEGHESMSRFLDMLRGVLFHSSTLYFVFISGYLFHFLAQRKFDLRTYYRKKTAQRHCSVCDPVRFFTGYAFFWYSYTGEVPRFTKLVTGCREFFQALLYGDVVLTYWYIPFIATIFLVSPLLLRLSEERFALLTLFTVWIPLLIPRTELTSFFHNYAFFFPAYLLGMFYSMNRDLILAFIAKHIKILVAFSLVFTALLGINAYEEILPNIEAAYYMQKIAIGACVVHFLEKRSNTSGSRSSISSPRTVSPCTSCTTSSCLRSRTCCSPFSASSCRKACSSCPLFTFFLRSGPLPPPDHGHQKTARPPLRYVIGS